MPEHQQREMPEHEQYEALCALAAGGLLESADFVDFQAHMKECSQCRADYQELSSVVTRELPKAQGTLQQKLAAMRAKPLPYSRQRFLRRARAEGVVFSREVEAPVQLGSWYLRPVNFVPVALLAVIAVGLTLYHFRQTPDTAGAGNASAQHIAELERENAQLNASLSQLNKSLAAGQREVQDLRAQLENAAATSGKLRQAQGEAEQSTSRNAQLLEESRNQEKLLAEAKDEAARVNQLRINDEASLVEQQARITELSDKLRIASATLDMERQLAASGKDVRELMASRQLHVIDIHDTDPNGEPSKAFGRVFLTEGKSLTFYGFDLNADRVVTGKHGFQVWAAMADGGKNSARSLGFLRVDTRASGRWVLRVENPELVKAISSVFVTVGDSKQPTGQKMLSAYLGEANHP